MSGTAQFTVRRLAGPGEMDAALALRYEVFCREQGVPAREEQDGRDKDGMHLVAVANGELLGTCRLLFVGPTVQFSRLAVARTAREKGLGNIETVEAPAEHLPFEDETFDFVASRFSAHHWRDFDAGLREARRTLKRGGRAALVDVYAPGQALFDTHLQAIELLRDHSHVRDYTSAQWLDTLSRSGFAIEACRTWRLRMDFPVWIARMQTPQDNVKAIRALQNAASAETRAHFAIEPDGSFLLDMLMVEASAA